MEPKPLANKCFKAVPLKSERVKEGGGGRECWEQSENDQGCITRPPRVASRMVRAAFAKRMHGPHTLSSSCFGLQSQLFASSIYRRVYSTVLKSCERLGSASRFEGQQPKPFADRMMPHAACRMPPMCKQ